jgi:serine/threonine protein kinase
LENILLSTEKHIKIADFGIAGFCRGNEKEKSDFGTLKYLPPEVISSFKS